MTNSTKMLQHHIGTCFNASESAQILGEIGNVPEWCDCILNDVLEGDRESVLNKLFELGFQLNTNHGL